MDYQDEVIELLDKHTNTEIARIIKERHPELKSPEDSYRRRVGELRKETKIIIKQDPHKILLFDIEIAPVLAYVWPGNMWNSNIGHKQLAKDWFMLSWSAKWLNDSKIMGDVLTPKEARAQNDKRIVKNLWSLLNQADIIIAHNGDKFDIPKVNSRFIIHSLTPTKPYQSIDTFKIAKRQFGFTYNKLDHLGNALGVGRKIDTDFDLWKDCYHGDSMALLKMLEYNQQDVFLLEDVYLMLRGWVNAHPNINKYQDTKDCCSHCGGHNLKENGYYYTHAYKYKSYQCKECGAFSRVSGKQLLSTAR